MAAGVDLDHDRKLQLLVLIMKDRIDSVRKRGRPRVDALPITLRLAPDRLARLDDWIARHGKRLSRPEAVRVLVDRTLTFRNELTAMASQEFEIARLLMVRCARNGEIDRSTGFAWANRIYPVFHGGPLAEAFKDDFEVGADEVGLVLRIIDEMAEQNDGSVMFYSLETALNVKSGGPLTRGQLIDCCRYIFLDGRFSEAVWSSLTKSGSGPVESQSLAQKDLRPEWDLPFNT